MSDHERIWLQNAEDAKHALEGRLWCQDKVWPGSPEDGEPTEYVRADLVATARADARREALEEAVAAADHMELAHPHLRVAPAIRALAEKEGGK